ncbi:MAG TPA: carbohydrate ABC transporter permease [Ramlibacter sp.]|uniref:carbohydrate ABC transporter permease n=1 Tax=Ramlibacter sp. TaxID=1917967 RepID=UPI002C012CF3|nr:carbohydrate ABC transporter permease [Ramlibacter sp.]HVZ43538.1 carbohydrate ABC transporter permease [Ramlibacter sp.]
MSASIRLASPRRLRALRSNAAALAVAALMVLPLLWGVATSFKTEVMSVAYPPSLWPTPFIFDNYVAVATGENFLRQLLNSLLYSLGSVLLAMAVAAPAGYALARIDFRGKELVNFVVMACAMVPSVAILIPTYFLLDRLGLLNNRLMVQLIFAAQLAPQSVWFIRNFIDALPKEIDEAAHVDGASRFETFRLIILPLIKPGLAAVFVLGIITVWNDYIAVAAFAPSLASRTLQVALVTQVFDTSGMSWGYVMAFAIMTSLPTVVIFLGAQRWFIAGLTAGGVKG